MRSSRSSEGSRYKILFIIVLLLLAIVCVLYVMKVQEVSALSATLDEAKKEADSNEWGLNQKVSELQQRLDTQAAHLREYEKKITDLRKDCNASKQMLLKCGEDLASLQKAKDAHEEQLKVAHDEGIQLESKVAELQDALSAEQKNGDNCKQEFAESQATVDKCTQSTDAIKAELKSCIQRCPVTGNNGNAALSEPVKREENQGMHFNQPQPVQTSPSLAERESLIDRIAPGEAQELQKEYDYKNEENPGNVQDQF